MLGKDLCFSVSNPTACFHFKYKSKTTNRTEQMLVCFYKRIKVTLSFVYRHFKMLALRIVFICTFL